LTAGLVVAALQVPSPAQVLDKTLSWNVQNCPKTEDSYGPWCLPGESAVGYAMAVASAPQSASLDWPPCFAEFGANFRVLLDKAQWATASARYPPAIAGEDIANWLISNRLIGGAPGEWVRHTDGKKQSNCVGLIVSVPHDATITRIQLTVSEENTVTGSCGIVTVQRGQLVEPQARYRCKAVKTPTAKPEEPFAACGWESPRIAGNTVAAPFANWSSGKSRTPYLRVYYK
jgi:hypothetical protein